ncbi:endolytic transglycosylase MltG [Legionella sp. W05-934-2]|uniref:endolytic transglycosylase MltG n=1 Tax=Legionella sp. W05-934-2 TaxID=1198649 RepID=UPI003461D650
MAIRWVVALGIIILIGIGTWGGRHIYQFYQPNPDGHLHSDYITIEKNTTLNQVCQQLFQKGVIKQPKLLSFWLRILGMDKIQAGVYQFVGKNAVIQFMDDLNKGRVVQLPFVIIAGKTWSSIQTHLLSMPWLKHDLSSEVIEEISPSNTLDGLLLADTYYFTAGSKASDLIFRANQHLKTVLNKSWQSRDEGLPYKTPYEMLIAASIIEKETAIDDERPIISQVIVNRLQNHMRLQMDPTVIYALGTDYQGVLSKDDLQVKSPYNTYRYSGLPPTPIAMVSQASIEAAAHPRTGNYLYFVASGDGHHFFSSNYQQHRQAVDRYIQGKS